MNVTRETVVRHFEDYLHGTLPIAGLVDWAESAMCEGEFDEGQAALLSDVVARIGVADVRAFGLAWEDYRDMLRSLGLSAKVDLVAA